MIKIFKVKYMGGLDKCLRRFKVHDVSHLGFGFFQSSVYSQRIEKIQATFFLAGQTFKN